MAEHDQAFDDQAQKIGQPQHEPSNGVEKSVRVRIEGWIISLVVAHLTVAVPANQNCRVVMFPTCDMMRFQAPIIGLSAYAATRRVRAKPFQPVLLSGFFGQFNGVHVDLTE
ncbi:hypothetical protein D1604_09615 [Brevundimonas sp. LPMIX5]|nr:hypothetical protein D1604_09615 [Brevundimonas sp. LPMIX5]